PARTRRDGRQDVRHHRNPPEGSEEVRRIVLGIVAGLIASFALLQLVPAHGRGRVHTRLVAEDPSAPLAKVAIHYAPSADHVALGVWRQLFAVLPPSVEVEVEVAQASDFDRFLAKLAGTPHLERFHHVVVGAQITTWSRDRYAALVDDNGAGAILAPPR